MLICLAVLQVVQPSMEGNIAVLHLMLFAIMHPNSSMRATWDTYILMLLFSVCIVVPYMICFDVTVHKMSVIGAVPS